MIRLVNLAAFLVGAISGMSICAAMIFTAPQKPAEEPIQIVQNAVMEDSPAPSVPIYLQTDERWGGLPYADETLSVSGCGLTCAAMAWSYFSGDDWTPVEMLNAVGNDFVQEGQNYMPGFCSWMHEQDADIASSVIYEDMERALDDLEGGSLIFAEMQGRIEDGGRSYGGHIVLLTGFDEENVIVHDPCSPYAVTLSLEQMTCVDWGYFISVWRS